MNQYTPEFEAIFEAKRKKKEKRAKKWFIGKAYEPEPLPVGLQNFYLFTYGTLMDPTQLERLLDRKPVQHDARVIGYKMMMWGPYPALVEEPFQPVCGKAFEIETKEELEILKSYETNMYRYACCLILLKGAEKEIFGHTFLWNGPEDMIEEGTFDLTTWQKRQVN